jgi:hypothetical protein
VGVVETVGVDILAEEQCASASVDRVKRRVLQIR